MSCSSPARFPATACARSSTSASAPTRTLARSRCSSPAPSASRRIADHPGVPWQVLPYERQLEIKQAQVDEALRRIGQARRLRARGDRAGAGAVALPQQARVLLRRWTSRGRWCAAFTPRRVGDGSRRSSDCLLASERGNRARELALRWCRAQGLTAWERSARREDGRLGAIGEVAADRVGENESEPRPVGARRGRRGRRDGSDPARAHRSGARRARAPAQPGRARGPAHRQAAGAPRDHRRRARRGALARR